MFKFKNIKNVMVSVHGYWLQILKCHFTICYNNKVTFFFFLFCSVLDTKVRHIFNRANCCTTRFKPAWEDPCGFLGHHLNHSATIVRVKWHHWWRDCHQWLLWLHKCPSEQGWWFGQTVARKQVTAPFCYKIKSPHSVKNSMLGPKWMWMDL